MSRVRNREVRPQLLEELRAHLDAGARDTFRADEHLHPADLADVLWLDFEADEARLIFESLPAEMAAEVLAESEAQLQERLLERLGAQAISDLLEQIPADDGADILEVLDEARRHAVLSHLEPSDATDLRHLGAYEPDTAGGLMTTEFITAPPEEKVGDLLKRVRRDEGEAETIATIYMVGPGGELLGVLSARELLESNIHQPVADIANPDVIHARTDEDQEEIARRILHYNLNTIPVVDPRSILVGIITSDDALEVLEDEGSEDALLLAGAGVSSGTTETLLHNVIHRAPMLAVTVAAGLIMSRVMDYFAPRDSHPRADGSEDPWVTILSYIPMVLALSGTIGNQTSAVMVRGFAVGEIRSGRRRAVFLGEVQIGVALGVLCTILAIPAVTMFASGDWMVGLSLGLALFLAMSWTATVATSIAMGSHAAGLDPALVSGPVMMAVSDLSAVLLFFGVARLLLT